MNLVAESLTCQFDPKAKPVVEGVNLVVRKGELCALVGPNGAGKSTLLKMLSGFLRPTSGTITLGKRRLTGIPMHQFARAGIARKFQTPSLFDDLTVWENLWLAAGGTGGLPSNNAVDSILCELGLETLVHQQASELSYGQRQWLEIGLAMMTRPSFLLLDEPAAGLSAAETDLTRDLIIRISSEIGVVLIEHDLALVAELSCRTVLMRQGKIIGEGELADLREEMPKGMLR